MSRAQAPAPTGIDRVEMAYARYLLEHEKSRTQFCAMHPLGLLGTLPLPMTEDFIGELAAAWEGDGEGQAVLKARRLGHRLLRWRGGFPAEKSGPCNAVYLLTSHHHLTRPRIIGAALKRWRAFFVPMLHDLIPLDYPEYARPREPARHARRLATITHLADAVIVPSDAVGAALHSRLTETGRPDVPVWVVPHGIPHDMTRQDTLSDGMAVRWSDRPYFVCIGTIEPRKNHLLLLNLWRRMATECGARAPRMILIGKRGWENENIVDMLERCPALSGSVIELNDLPDRETAALLRGARGLLFPSFTEGFGLPLAEALALGVPVICSDIPVFREIGGDVPYYADPLDGPGWRAAIDDFCAGGSRYVLQKQLLAGCGFRGWTQSIGESIKQIDSFFRVKSVSV